MRKIVRFTSQGYDGSGLLFYKKVNLRCINDVRDPSRPLGAIAPTANRRVLPDATYFNPIVLFSISAVGVVKLNLILRPAALALLADVCDLETASTTLPFKHGVLAPLVFVGTSLRL
jgi:hypothetical protein